LTFKTGLVFNPGTGKTKKILKKICLFKNSVLTLTDRSVKNGFMGLIIE